MELICLGVVGVASMVLVLLCQQEPVINVQDYLKELPAGTPAKGPGLKAVSGMVAQRVKQQELRFVVSQDPENAAQTVKLWLKE